MNGFKYLFTVFAEIVPEGLTVLCVARDCQVQSVHDVFQV